MKRRHFYTKLIILLWVAFLVFPISIYADMGPKDSLTIYVENPPNEPYYLDLLTQENAEQLYENLTKDEQKLLDQSMLKLLSNYAQDGWHLALVQGTHIPMWGDLTGIKDGNQTVHNFGYYGLPKTYKIIIVTQSGKVTISDTYERQSLQSSITYDYNSNQAKTPPVAIAYLLQFLSTCLPTLLVEGMILLLFGFSLKQNYKLFLLLNIITQIILTVTLGVTLIRHGSMTVYFTQLPIEFGILLVETLCYAKWLKGHSVLRRCLYGITANLVSFTLGLLLLNYQYRWLTSFL